MADAKGDIFREDGLVLEENYTKTNVSVTKGKVVVFDTDGYAHCGAATAALTKAFMANSSVVADGATRQKLVIVRQGYCRVAKVAGAGAIDSGNTPTFAASGELTTGANAVGNMIVVTSNNAAALFYEVYIG